MSGRDSLPPEIHAFIDQTAKNDGFFIKDAPTGTLIEIETYSGSTYRLAVSNPAKQEVALTGPREQLREPHFFRFEGSTGGGSMIRVGWLGVGQCLKFRGPVLVLTTSPVVSFRLNGDPNLARQMIEEAERHRPKPFTAEDEARFDNFVDGLIAGFPPELQDRARELVYEFNFEGRGIMIQIMRLANERGRLKDALNLLRDQYRRHWQYRAPEIRGSFITPEDEKLVIEAYEKLGLPLPTKGN